MRNRIAKILIVLAVLLILGDLAWVLPRLAPFLLDAVRKAPEATMLAGALCLLIAAWVVRRQPRCPTVPAASPPPAEPGS
jgi:hypothetical protein